MAALRPAEVTCPRCQETVVVHVEASSVVVVNGNVRITLVPRYEHECARRPDLAVV